MEPVQAKEIPTERKIFADTWQLLTQYYHLSADNETGWNEAIIRADNICKAAQGNPAAFELTKAITIAILKYIEKRQQPGSEK